MNFGLLSNYIDPMNNSFLTLRDRLPFVLYGERLRIVLCQVWNHHPLSYCYSCEDEYG